MGDIYKIGKCIICGRERALKNNICAQCNKSSDGFTDDNNFKNLFEQFGFGGK